MTDFRGPSTRLSRLSSRRQPCREKDAGRNRHRAPEAVLADHDLRETEETEPMVYGRSAG